MTKISICFSISMFSRYEFQYRNTGLLGIMLACELADFAAVQIDVKLKLLFARQTPFTPGFVRVRELHAAFQNPSADVHFTGKRRVLCWTRQSRDDHSRKNLCGSNIRINDSHVSLFFLTCHSAHIASRQAARVDRQFAFPHCERDASRVCPRSFSNKRLTSFISKQTVPRDRILILICEANLRNI